MRCIVLFCLVSVGLVAGCESKPAPRSGKPIDPAHATLGVQDGQRAPNIEAADTDGKRFALADYKGKVILLDFWASW